MPGSKLYKNQHKILNRLYWKVAHTSRRGAPYRPRSARRAWADAQDARKAMNGH